MVADWDVVWVVYVRSGDEGTAAAFVIDGRDYDEQARRGVVAEAWDELEVRHIVAEFETRPAIERPDWLPTWEQYRASLGEVGGDG